jgi:predicted glycoside hydrolase/deacetylase ChbG (UPF0249 family)
MTRSGAAIPLRHIWICADDYGLSPGVNTAIRDLLQHDRINATSVMVLPPSFGKAAADELLALKRQKPRIAIGLHVTLTAPFSPLTSGFTPLRDGVFLPLKDTLLAASRRRYRIDNLIAEITAQLQAFTAAFGCPPDFIDGHQHVQLFPLIRDAVLAVAARSAPNAWLRQCGRAIPWPQRLSDRKGLLLDILSVRFRSKAARLGLRTNPAFAGTYAFTPDADFARLLPGFLGSLPEGGLMMCHPGFVDDELKRLDPLTVLREHEYACFMADTYPQLLAGQGVTLG